MRISKNSQQNNSETLQMRMIKKYLKKGIYLRRKTENYWNYMISNNQVYDKLKSGLCDYSDACILVSGTITTNGAGVDDNAKQLYERNKVVIFKNCAPFTDCISEINNAQVENAKDLDVVML